jgi:GH35 family endo-1,4-beta-xylanase
MKYLAFIKDNIVVNTAVFDDDVNDEFLSLIKEQHQIDALVPVGSNCAIGHEFDGVNFWGLSPYPSWVKGEKEWQAPKPYPIDENHYVWNESLLDWDRLPTE